MTALAVLFLSLAAVAALVWLGTHYTILLEARSFALDAGCAGPPSDAPFLSVVVAAKDEEDNIGPCLRTMLDQDYPSYEVLVANDRSVDRTPQLIEEIAAGDPRLTVIHVEHLPAGWFGKSHAMQTAIARARGEWIVMIDADTRQLSRRTLSVAMQYAKDTGSDLLSVYPQLEMHGFLENAIQPVMAGVMMVGFHPDRVNDPRRREAYANGAFMMIRRAAYERVGTHAAVRSCLAEDMQLAHLCKESGLRTRVVRNRDLYTCRMYSSLREILSGWGRIYYACFGTLPRILGAMLLLVLMSSMPYAALTTGLFMARHGAAGAGLWQATAVAAAAAATLQLTAIFRFYRLGGLRAELAWTYPLASFVALGALGISLRHLRKGSTITWRGTTYATSHAAVGTKDIHRA